MEQQHSTPPPSPPLPPMSFSKEWGGKETLSVVFLVLFLPIGLILMWTLANWSKKAKVIITIVLLLPIITIDIIIATLTGVLSGAVERGHDACIITQMGQIRIEAVIFDDGRSLYIF